MKNMRLNYMNSHKLLLIIFLFGCNSDVLNKKNNTNNNSYTNIYIGDPKDLVDGPCCQKDLDVEEDYDFIVATQPTQNNSFTFRGWADCTGQCFEDIKACVTYHWATNQPYQQTDICKTYSCGSFGIAYIISTYGAGSTYGQTYSVGYPGAISPYDPIEKTTIHSAYARSQRFCVAGEYLYYDESLCFNRHDNNNKSEIKVPKTDYPYPHGYLFKDVYQCTNEITYVLDTSNDDYYGLKNYDPAEKNKVERTREDCLDGIDNDNDNFADCDDYSCRNVLHDECND